MHRTVAVVCVGVMFIATTVYAQVSIPNVELPADGAAFLSWVRANVDRGLEAAGIHPERFPAIETFAEKFAEIQFIRFDDMPVVTGAWEKVRGALKGTLGISPENLIQTAFQTMTRLFESGIEWVKSSTR